VAFFIAAGRTSRESHLAVDGIEASAVHSHWCISVATCCRIQ